MQRQRLDQRDDTQRTQIGGRGVEEHPSPLPLLFVCATLSETQLSPSDRVEEGGRSGVVQSITKHLCHLTQVQPDWTCLPVSLSLVSGVKQKAERQIRRFQDEDSLVLLYLYLTPCCPLLPFHTTEQCGKSLALPESRVLRAKCLSLCFPHYLSHGGIPSS